MKYLVQISYTNPAHEHISLRRRVETVNRIVEAVSEEEALNRAANQQRALGFKIQEAKVVTPTEEKSATPASFINESKSEKEMEKENEMEDEEEEDEEDEDEDEAEDMKEGIAADMFAARREKAQKKIADMLLKRDMEASKKDREMKRQAGTMKPMKESVEYIEEKLTASDPASKWIADFVKSDNPKFAGKSKKERINQALGAYYAAKRGKVEEGFDPSPAEIAKMLVKKHGAGNVTKQHILDLESDRDSFKGLDHDEVMKHVKKMDEEVELDEANTRVVNKEVKKDKEAKATETAINLAKSKKNKVDAKPTLDVTNTERKYVTRV